LVQRGDLHRLDRCVAAMLQVNQRRRDAPQLRKFLRSAGEVVANRLLGATAGTGSEEKNVLLI
jgi:hypothetical protein